MRLIFTRLRARDRRGLRELGFDRRAQLRRLRRNAAALARRRSSSRSGSSSPGPRRARSRAPASARRSGDRNLLCCDVGGTSTDISLVVDGRPFVKNTFELEHDLIINALSTRDLERRRRRRQHRLDLAVGRRPGRARERRLGARPGLLRPRRQAADDHRRLPAHRDPRPRRVRRRRARLDAERARQAFESLDTPLTLRPARRASRTGSRPRNIAEEVTNVAIRHGVDPRDFTRRRLRRGRADAAARGARRCCTSSGSSSRRTRAFLGARAAEHRSRLLRQPQRLRAARARRGAADRLHVRGDGGAAARARRRRGGRRRCGAASTGGCSARAGRRRSSSVPDGPITAETIARADRALPRRVRAALRQPLPVHPGAGRHLPRRAHRRRPTRSSTSPAERRRATAEPDRTIELRHFAAEPLDGGRVRARASCRSALASRGPAVIREALSTTFVCPGQVRRRSAASARSSSRTAVSDDLTCPDPRPRRRRFAARYGCDRFTATVLGNRFGYLVEHMCSQLLTAAFSPILRDFYDFAATVTGPPAAGYPTPAMSNSIVLFTGTMTDSVRNTIEEYGPERLEPGDVIVANDPYRDGHARQRPAVHPAGLPRRRRSSAFVNLQGAPARHGRDRARRLHAARSATSTRTAWSLSPRALFKGGKPVQRDLEPDLRQRPLRRRSCSRTCRRSAPNLDLGERLLVGDRRALRPRGGATARCATSATPSAERMQFALAAIPDGEWEGEDLRRLRRRSTTPRNTASTSGSPSAAAGPRSTSAAARGRRARASTHAARREDDRRRRLQVPVRPARPFTVGADALRRPRPPRRARS